jgi:hypothetical protein
MTPEKFKELTAIELGQGTPPGQVQAAAKHFLGEAEALLFLAGGWQEYVQNRPVRHPTLKHINFPRTKKTAKQTTPPKPLCKYELHIVEYCTCPKVPSDIAELRHVRECGHEKQDGALCTRGPNNGKIIYCAECSFHPLNSKQPNE